jgi:hypothetical protein
MLRISWNTITNGKGKGSTVSTKKDLKDLLAEVVRQGFTVTQNKKHHYVVTKNGIWVATLASTPSEYRGYRNAVAALRRAGFIWKR